ncbi:hypothetical protein AK830_g5296 [Neonectria ditissima]|uniref:Xylanolytic transcriptional activator regulatory domain-containing protein n=1 Tax=Neonectria ditissima TaxID=78410 RepID=A0A0P7BM54_9HYPO|nr:hypothetical protein AK830_g5296 [Neonectria ditissima]
MDDENSPFQDGDAPGDGPDDVSDSPQNNASSSSIRRACDACRTRKPSASSVSTPFGHAVQPASDSPVIEAESSLTAHSIFANEFLQNAVGTDSLQEAGLEMRETLDSLHHIVDALKQQTPATEMIYTMANHTPRPALAGEHSDKATWIFDVCPLDNFSDICLGVYFSEDYSEADFIISNTGMMYLFQELAGSEVEGKEENLTYFEMCRVNVQTALNNLPLHLPANPNMIAALVLGSYHAIEISKPSLSWILTCKASELCQTLGYHRISSLKGPTDKKDRKQFLFWSVYFMDKSLSLRLGRASTIQDWDISVPIPATEDTEITPLSAFFSMWVKTARCQGNIYEQLYSPDSVTQPRYVRAARVAAITKDLEDIRKQTSEVSSEWLSQASAKIGAPMVQFISFSDDVLRLSLLTLAYRASPPHEGSRSTFVPECIEAARATLQRHQECMTCLIATNAHYFPSYVHWTLMFAPFIPFIVLFCQVIETQDERDLASLHNFVNSIETVPMVSDAAAKMHRLFQVLYTVALRFVEFRNSTPPPDQNQANAELNTYLVALGFPAVGPDQQLPTMSHGQGVQDFGQPQGEVSLVEELNGEQGVNPMMWMGNSAQLEDWFNSNNQMMELIEEPTFNFPH